MELLLLPAFATDLPPSSSSQFHSAILLQLTPAAAADCWDAAVVGLVSLVGGRTGPSADGKGPRQCLGTRFGLASLWTAGDAVATEPAAAAVAAAAAAHGNMTTFPCIVQLSE